MPRKESTGRTTRIKSRLMQKLIKRKQRHGARSTEKNLLSTIKNGETKMARKYGIIIRIKERQMISTDFLRITADESLLFYEVGRFPKECRICSAATLKRSRPT